MELRDLQTFVSVAAAGGFRRAAQQNLGRGGSTASKSVSVVDDRLRTSLFERNRAGVRLSVCLR